MARLNSCMCISLQNQSLNSFFHIILIDDFMSSADDVKEIIRNLNKENDFVHYASVKPLDRSSTEYHEELEKIFNSLKSLGLDVHYNLIKTSGISEHSIIGDYKKKDGIHGVFVEISCEAKDYGTVYVSSSKEKIESLKERLKESLGLEFKQLEFDSQGTRQTF